MSVFKVKLTQGQQGSLDEHAFGVNNASVSVGTGGGNVLVGTGTSVQRTVYVMGPGKVNRKLKDGDTFTDSNYWKRYCATPVGPLTPEQAIVSIVTDDGSVYDDSNLANSGQYTKVYNVSVPSASTFATNAVDGNYADVLRDTGSYATFAQLTLSTATDVKVKVNGDANAIFDITNTTVQIFNPGDISITLLEFQHVTGSSGTVQVVLGVRSKSNS